MAKKQTVKKQTKTQKFVTWYIAFDSFNGDGYDFTYCTAKEDCAGFKYYFELNLPTNHGALVPATNLGTITVK
jgi:hypothetical protein